jgi:AbrB family looped-hinge helix DNA binding protein
MYQRLTNQHHYHHQHEPREILSTITSKGQVTLPKAVRDQLGVATKDRISFVIAGDDTVTLQVPRFPTIASLAGIAGTLARPRSWAAMRQIARDDAVVDAMTGEERSREPHRTSGTTAGVTADKTAANT